MYINLNNIIINTKNLQKTFIDEKHIIIQYFKDGNILTDSISYENIKEDINEEKQLIEKDFERLEKVINEENNNLNIKIKELKDIIYKNDLKRLKIENLFFSITDIINNKFLFKKSKLEKIKDLIEKRFE